MTAGWRSDPLTKGFASSALEMFGGAGADDSLIGCYGRIAVRVDGYGHVDVAVILPGCAGGGALVATAPRDRIRLDLTRSG